MRRYQSSKRRSLTCARAGIPNEVLLVSDDRDVAYFETPLLYLNQEYDFVPTTIYAVRNEKSDILEMIKPDSSVLRREVKSVIVSPQKRVLRSCYAQTQARKASIDQLGILSCSRSASPAAKENEESILAACKPVRAFEVPFRQFGRTIENNQRIDVTGELHPRINSSDAPLPRFKATLADFL